MQYAKSMDMHKFNALYKNSIMYFIFYLHIKHEMQNSNKKQTEIKLCSLMTSKFLSIFSSIHKVK